ncbi:hypothetical protein OROGR_004868 [Orobanche gracilis]
MAFGMWARLGFRIFGGIQILFLYSHPKVSGNSSCSMVCGGFNCHPTL